MLYELTRLENPLEFLIGARIPLIMHGVVKDWKRHEWSLDCILARLSPEGPWSERQPPRDWRFFALDCADPAVSAWVDRRLAERLTVRGKQSIEFARLVLFSVTDGWRLEIWHVNDSQPESITGCVLPCNPKPYTLAALPVARAALLDALFGVKS